MIFNTHVKFKIKKKLFRLSRLSISSIKKEYILSLSNSKYLKYKRKHTLKSQKSYIKKINSSLDNFILGIYTNNKLVGSMNAQTYKKIDIGNKKLYNTVSFGILIFEKYQKKNIGKNSVKIFSRFLSKTYNNIFSTIDERNVPSINAFKYANFRKMTYKKGKTLFFLYKKK
jgi:hypothetical protein